MHISNGQIQKVLELHLHKVYATRGGSGPGFATGADELILSTRAAEMQQLKQAVARSPEIRSGLVQDLKQKVQSGNYQIDPQGLAAEIVDAAGRGETKP